MPTTLQHGVNGAAEAATAATARVGAIGIVNAATDEFVVDIRRNGRIRLLSMPGMWLARNLVLAPSR
jgi:hypothetical protein